MLTIKIPTNIQLQWGDDYIQFEGPLGLLIKKREPFNIALRDSILYVWGVEKNDNAKLLFIWKLLIGVWKGYFQKLRIVGIGFRVLKNNKELIFKIGYSHEIHYKIPDDVQIYVSKNKGTLLIIKGKEEYRVQQIAYEIRCLYWPDPYKGKGVFFDKEKIVLKKGKKETK